MEIWPQDGGIKPSGHHGVGKLTIQVRSFEREKLKQSSPGLSASPE